MELEHRGPGSATAAVYIHHPHGRASRGRARPHHLASVSEQAIGPLPFGLHQFGEQRFGEQGFGEQRFARPGSELVGFGSQSSGARQTCRLQPAGMTRLEPVLDLQAVLGGTDFDALVLVAPAADSAPDDTVREAARAVAAVDAGAFHGGPTVHAAPGLPGGRLVLAPTGTLLRDGDDVRRYSEAAGAGMRRARDGGATRPLLVIAGIPSHPSYQHAVPLAAVGAAGGLWQPLEAREALGADTVEPVDSIGVAAPDHDGLEDAIRWANAIEAGRRVARDIGGTEPERMAPPRMAEYCAERFQGGAVNMEVVSDRETLERDYPLLSGVARASWQVERHHPRVIRMSYGDPNAPKSIFLAGKGLSYDTGGADIKAGGVMAGMSRDKGGGAAVAGLFQALEALRPKDVYVAAEIGCVRNSIGEDCFVSDEIIRSHAGARVRIGNTDAEGRLVLADLLSHLRLGALKANNSRILSVATLTGHSARAVGPYSIALDNAAAHSAGVATTLQEVGDAWGDPFDISRLRREDWQFVRPRTRADDTLSCNNAPSTATARGHQFPMAFLAIASGLDQHGPDSSAPLCFTHIDIGGSGVEGSDWQHGRPSGSPIISLMQGLIL